ncbi:MAG: hypothetical protein J0I41_00555 [Filimonas sp.]|nr:hypothetical protein [Filimonas sp.]
MDHSLSSATGNTAFSVSLQIGAFTSSDIIVNYQGIMGNMPAAYSNAIVVFPSSDPLFPYSSTSTPLADYRIPNNVSSGSVAIPVAISEGAGYVFGYAVGTALQAPAQYYGNVCSSAWWQAGERNAKQERSSLSITYVSPTIISVVYEFGNGVMPGANGAWIGVWQGTTAFYNVPPAVKQPVTQNTSTGNVAINVTVLRGVTYTLGLFTSGFAQHAQTTLAATCTFST